MFSLFFVTMNARREKSLFWKYVKHRSPVARLAPSKQPSSSALGVDMAIESERVLPVVMVQGCVCRNQSLEPSADLFQLALTIQVGPVVNVRRR